MFVFKKKYNTLKEEHELAIAKIEELSQLISSINKIHEEEREDLRKTMESTIESNIKALSDAAAAAVEKTSALKKAEKWQNKLEDLKKEYMLVLRDNAKIWEKGWKSGYDQSCLEEGYYFGKNTALALDCNPYATRLEENPFKEKKII
jgi:membrane-associated HD superfamily phosphohydrolase